MIIEICVVILTVSFVALVIYLIAVTKALRCTLFQVNQTLIQVRRQLEDVGGNAAKAVEHTNQISFDLKRKIESLDPFFNAFSNVGNFLEHKTFSWKRGVSAVDRDAGEASAMNESIKAADVVDFFDVSYRLWQKIKKRSKR